MGAYGDFKGVMGSYGAKGVLMGSLWGLMGQGDPMGSYGVLWALIVSYRVLWGLMGAL